MTFIAGWKNNNAVFIIGDSLITYKDEKNTGLSTSFGEIPINGNKREDVALKVNLLEDKLIVAFAGVVYKCKNFVKDLNHKIKTRDSNILTLIKETIVEHKDKISNECAFIFGCIYGGKPCLFSYNGKDPNHKELREVSDFVRAGSINKSVLAILHPISIFVKKLNFDDSKTMVSLCALLQSFVLRESQIEKGIGGFFAGAYINNQGVKWLDDTTYLIYDKDFPIANKGINISIALRGNGALIYTPQADVRNKIFLNVYTKNPKEETRKWQEMYYEEANKKINSSDSKYIVFLHKTRPIVGVLDTKNKEFIKVKSVSEFRREWAFNGKWLNKLHALYVPSRPDSDEGYPFTFHYGWN